MPKRCPLYGECKNNKAELIAHLDFAMLDE